MMSGVGVRPLHADDITAMASIMTALRPWFTPEAVVEMQGEALELDGLVAVDSETELMGFVLWQARQTGWELKWIGVAPAHHRRGLGRQLVDALMDRMRASRATRLMVATVAPSVDYEPYARTRAFYEGLGFALTQVEPSGWPDGTDKGTYVLEVPRLSGETRRSDRG
jgi:ribosomal protein S18 acetylase RimI-like enzyme